METKQILAEIDAEILKLQQARSLLIGTAIKRGRGRPKNAATAATEKMAKGTMSAAVRARISAAQKARWAKTKRASKKQV